MHPVPFSGPSVKIPSVFHNTIFRKAEPSLIRLIAHCIGVLYIRPLIVKHCAVVEDEFPLMPLRRCNRGRTLRHVLADRNHDVIGIHMYPISVNACGVRGAACSRTCSRSAGAAAVTSAVAAVTVMIRIRRIGAAVIKLPYQHEGAEGVLSCFSREFDITTLYRNRYRNYRSICNSLCDILIVVFSMQLFKMQKSKLCITVRSFRKRHINCRRLIASNPCVTIIVIYKVKVSGDTLIACLSCCLATHTQCFLEASVNQKLLSVIRQIQNFIGKKSDVSAISVKRTLRVTIDMKLRFFRNHCSCTTFLYLEFCFIGSYWSEHIFRIDITNNQGRGVNGDAVNHICSILIRGFNHNWIIGCQNSVSIWTYQQSICAFAASCNSIYRCILQYNCRIIYTTHVIVRSCCGISILPVNRIEKV